MNLINHYFAQACEITFDVKDTMFRIRCRRDEEDAHVARARAILGRIINYGSGDKACPAKHWNADDLTSDELAEYDVFKTPRPVFRCAYKRKWSMPRTAEFEKLTIRDLHPGDWLPQIQSSTNAVLTLFNNELDMWIGSDSEDIISLVEKRMDTLVKYFVSRVDMPPSSSEANLL